MDGRSARPSRHHRLGAKLAWIAALVDRGAPGEFRTLLVEMRSPRTTFVAGALAWLVLLACSGAGAPPPDPARIGLQAGDLPQGLQRCAGSGQIDGYLRALQAHPDGRAAHDELAAAWTDLGHRGADAAAVSVFAALPVACRARLGTGDGPSVSSLVVRFPDDAGAAAAYRRGMLGFTTPGEGQEVDDMEVGVATGVGRNAWVLQRTVQGRAFIVGCWERDRVAVLFVAVDADPLHAKQAMMAVSGRIP